MRSAGIVKKTIYLQAYEELISELSLATRLIIYVGLVSFFISLLLTSLFTSGDDIRGLWILFIGWIGLIIFQFSWFANPLNLLALLLVNKRPFVALLLTIIAFILASQTFIFSEIPTGVNFGKIYIKELGLGFYFWYMAQGLFLLGVLLEAFRRIQKNED